MKFKSMINFEEISLKVFTFFYNLALFGVYFCTLPKILIQKYFYGKYSYSISERMGYNFPKIDSKGRFVIWIHAVSVGETLAVVSLVRELKKKFDNPYIIVSSITETGHAEAKKNFICADAHVFLPLDFSWIINSFVKKCPPNLVIISETDFWFNFLSSCKNVGAKIALVNGKLSKKSTERLKLFNFFAKKLFNTFDLICLQSEQYYSRFIEVGCVPDKLFVTGNLKLDSDPFLIKPEELSTWKKELGIQEKDFVVVVGSTHHPEESLLIDKFRIFWEKGLPLKVVLVPRHPERFDKVADYLSSQEIPFVRLSATKYKKGEEKVILIDSMGLLKKCYQLADLAIVAGSFCEGVGGHNIIEPCWYGVPTLFGPNMNNQLELVDLVKKYQSGLQLQIEDLQGTITSLFTSKIERERLGQGGLLLVDSSKGASEVTLNLIINGL